jgi:hypothetical protein
MTPLLQHDKLVKESLPCRRLDPYKGSRVDVPRGQANTEVQIPLCGKGIHYLDEIQLDVIADDHLTLLEKEDTSCVRREYSGRVPLLRVHSL